MRIISSTYGLILGVIFVTVWTFSYWMWAISIFSVKKTRHEINLHFLIKNVKACNVACVIDSDINVVAPGQIVPASEQTKEGKSS